MNYEVEEAFNEIRQEIRGLASPWKTRKQSANYLQTSTSAIDRLSDAGTLKRYYLAGQPRFHIKDLDALPSRKKQSIAELKELKDAPPQASRFTPRIKPKAPTDEPALV